MDDGKKDQEIARKVAESAFGLTPLLTIKHLPRGRINLTFLVQTPEKAFILQRLHPTLGLDGTVIRNVVAVTSLLNKKGVSVPRVLPARDGAWWVEQGGLWRVLTFLPGQPPLRRSVKMAVEAARLLGQFHRALADDPPSLSPLPLADHNRDGPAPTQVWEEITVRYAHRAGFGRALPVLEKGRFLALKLPPFSPTTRIILHGDPKLENFLFDDHETASGLVDLDMVRFGSLLWELADALRSWTGVKGSGGRTVLSQDIFTEAVRSYKKHGLDLSPEEWRQLPAATRAMALDLARRYLVDYFEEKYFSWDREQYPSLADQNITRANSLVDLAEDLEDNEQLLVERIGS